MRFFLICFIISISTLSKGQNSEVHQSVEGQNYWINTITEFNSEGWSYRIPKQHILTEDGEVIFACYIASKFHVLKFDRDVNLVSQIEINAKIEDKKIGIAEPNIKFLFAFDNSFAIICRYLNVGNNTESYAIYSFDKDLKSISNRLEVISSHEIGDKNIDFWDDEKTIKRLNLKYDIFQQNENGLVILRRSYNQKERKIIHHVIRLDNKGKHIYSKEILLDERDEPVTLSSSIFQKDGSFVSIGQKGDKLLYQEITPEGDEISGDIILEGKFHLINSYNNPDRIDEFMLVGFDDNLELKLLYYSTDESRRFLGNKNIAVIEMGDKIQNFNFASYLGKIENNRFYFASLGWTGGYKEGWHDKKNTSFLGVSIDLANEKFEPQLVLKPVYKIYDKFASDKTSPTNVCTLKNMQIYDNTMWVNLENYADPYLDGLGGGPGGQFTYSYKVSRRVEINPATQQISYTGDPGIIWPSVHVVNGVPTEYEIYNDLDFQKSPYALRSKTLVLGEVNEDWYCHFSDKLKSDLIFTTIGVSEESNGMKFLYATTTQSKFILVKLPIK